MQNPNKLSLFLAIEGYKNGDLTEDLMRTAVDAYSKSIIESNKSKELSDEALEIKFRFAISGKCFSDIAAERAAEDCAQIAKQYSDSKLSELEKWCDEQFKHADSLDNQDDTETRYFGGKRDAFSLLKIKIQSLKAK